MDVQVDNQELRVDGPVIIVFWGDISFTMEKVSKGFMSSGASGEGYVNIYKGTATLWISMKKRELYLIHSISCEKLMRPNVGNLGT